MYSCSLLKCVAPSLVVVLSKEEEEEGVGCVRSFCEKEDDMWSLWRFYPSLLTPPLCLLTVYPPLFHNDEYIYMRVFSWDRPSSSSYAHLSLPPFRPFASTRPLLHPLVILMIVNRVTAGQLFVKMKQSHFGGREGVREMLGSISSISGIFRSSSSSSLPPSHRPHFILLVIRVLVLLLLLLRCL